jgi:hypothetical protein
MPNTDLRQPLIRDEVLATLGFSGVDIELEESDIAVCTRQALRIYARYLPRYATKALTVTSGVKKYELSESDHPEIKGVLEVQFYSDTGSQSDSDPFNQEDNILNGVKTLGGETAGELDFRVGYTEDARRIFGSSPDYFYQQEAQEDGTVNYCLYIDLPEGITTEVSYTWVGGYTPDNQSRSGMQHIPSGDVDWLISMTTAKAKQMLGRIRGKFQGIPTPDGGTDSNDYSELMSEGREDEMNLIEDIKLRKRPLPPVIG